MVGAGVDSKDTRRLVMVALRKAGYAKPRRKSINGNAEAGPSIPTPVEVLVSITMLTGLRFLIIREIHVQTRGRLLRNANANVQQGNPRIHFYRTVLPTTPL